MNRPIFLKLKNHPFFCYIQLFMQQFEVNTKNWWRITKTNLDPTWLHQQRCEFSECWKIFSVASSCRFPFTLCWFLDEQASGEITGNYQLLLLISDPWNEVIIFWKIVTILRPVEVATPNTFQKSRWVRSIVAHDSWYPMLAKNILVARTCFEY